MPETETTVNWSRLPSLPNSRAKIIRRPGHSVAGANRWMKAGSLHVSCHDPERFFVAVTMRVDSASNCIERSYFDSKMGIGNQRQPFNEKGPSAAGARRGRPTSHQHSNVNGPY